MKGAGAANGTITGSRAESASNEKMLEQTAGKYSVGDEATMADVCLVPEMWTALARGLALEDYPVTKGVFERCMELAEFAEERTH